MIDFNSNAVFAINPEYSIKVSNASQPEAPIVNEQKLVPLLM